MIIKSAYLPDDSSFQHREEYTFSFDQLNEGKLPYIVDRFIYNNTFIESKYMAHDTIDGVPMIFGSHFTDTGAISVGFIFDDTEVDYVKNVDISTIKQSALKKLVTYLRDVYTYGV